MQAITLVIVFSFSMAHELVNGIGFIVDAEAIHDRGACLIEAQYFDLCAFTAELDDDLIQCGDGGNVPEVGTAEIDGHFAQCLLEVEGSDEFVRRAEEHLTGDLVDAVLSGFVQRGLDLHAQPMRLTGQMGCNCAGMDFKPRFPGKRFFLWASDIRY